MGSHSKAALLGTHVRRAGLASGEVFRWLRRVLHARRGRARRVALQLAGPRGHWRREHVLHQALAGVPGEGPGQLGRYACCDLATAV